MNLKKKAKQLKQELGTLYYAYKDKRTPLLAKVLSIIVVAYALSPIDLIPDFIPVLGYLDDLILLPIGIYFALKWIPKEVIATSRERAKKEFMNARKNNYIVATVILFIWILIIVQILKRI